MKIEVTSGMAAAALDSLRADDVENVITEDVRRALEAALANVEVPERVVAETMPRADALRMAHEMVDNLGTAPNNGRGYAADGWKVPTLAERTDAVLRLAAYLSGGADR